MVWSVLQAICHCEFQVKPVWVVHAQADGKGHLVGQIVLVNVLVYSAPLGVEWVAVLHHLPVVCIAEFGEAAYADGG